MTLAPKSVTAEPKVSPSTSSCALTNAMEMRHWSFGTPPTPTRECCRSSTTAPSQGRRRRRLEKIVPLAPTASRVEAEATATCGAREYHPAPGASRLRHPGTPRRRPAARQTATTSLPALHQPTTATTSPCHAYTSDEPSVSSTHIAALLPACLPVLAGRRVVTTGCSAFCRTQVLKPPGHSCTFA
jgi:hypothetical protein